MEWTGKKYWTDNKGENGLFAPYNENAKGIMNTIDSRLYLEKRGYHIVKRGYWLITILFFISLLGILFFRLILRNSAAK